MKDSCYIIVGRNGISSMRKTPGFNIKDSELAIFVKIEVPDDAFKKPRIETEIKITKEMIPERTIEPITHFEVDKIKQLEKELNEIKESGD